MNLSKTVSITFAAATLAIGVVALAPQQADASYYYKYTDKRPPVLTPGYVPVAVPATNTATTPVETVETTPAATTTANVAPKSEDYPNSMAYSLAMAKYYMDQILAKYNGNTALNRYGH